MAQDWVDQVLADFDASRLSTGDPMLDAVQAAILLEDVFGVTLADSDITPESLSSTAAIRETLRRLQGLG